MQKSDLYFGCLLKHLSAIDGLSDFDKNKYWITEYNKLVENINKRNTDQLPFIMTLIYPLFLYNSDGEWLGELTKFDEKGFTNGVTMADRCQYNQIQKNGNCQFNNYDNIRGKCQSDHFWPHSLGGPSILGNRIILCKFHNLAKSNSIIEIFWLVYPTWINDHLKMLYKLKI